MNKISKISIKLLAAKIIDGNFIIATYKGSMGLFDKKWNLLMPIEFDSIKHWRKYFIVLHNGKYGVFDEATNEVLPIEYDEVIIKGKYIVPQNKANLSFNGNSVCARIIPSCLKAVPKAYQIKFIDN